MARKVLASPVKAICALEQLSTRDRPWIKEGWVIVDAH
jgi:hypothetical protein